MSIDNMEEKKDFKYLLFKMIENKFSIGRYVCST